MARRERQKACEKIGLVWQKLTDEPENGAVIGLGEPPMATCKSILAQGGGKRWASSVYYLLTGKKVVSV